MKIIKRHKGLAIVGGLALVLLIVIFAIFSRMIFSTGKGEYGDRLNDIVKVDKSVTDEVIKKTKEYSEVEDVTIRIQGKIIYTIITYTESTSKDKAKEIASKTIEYYNDEILGCYDLEFFLTQKEKLNDEGKDTSYTIAGTKHPNKEKISWTKN